MSQLQVLKTAYDALNPERWVELCEQFNVPVMLGEPAVVEIKGVEFAVFDDPRLTEEHALVLVVALDG